MKIRQFLMPMACVMLLSCSQEEIIRDKDSGNDRQITFRAGMGTRVNSDFNYVGSIGTFYVTGFVGSHMPASAGATLPTAKFSDVAFTMTDESSYTSTDVNAKWPDDGSSMEFFAYAPSLEAIKTAAKTQLTSEQENTYFDDLIKFYNACGDDAKLDPIVGSKTFENVTTLTKGYKLGRFYVANDISQQVDFITAHTSGATKDQSHVGVPLTFFHQLSNIELKAFSGNGKYNIDIAGVRIGGAYTGRAMFNFCDTENSVGSERGGKWCVANDPQRLTMQYIFKEGDKIYKMGGSGDSQSHSNKDKAESIMGNGGNAMVIPTKNKAWEGMANPWIAPKYSSDNTKDPLTWGSANGTIDHGDMYFSILVRVTTKTGGNQIYPYTNHTGMNVVNIKQQDGTVKSNSEESNYGSIEGDELEFGWVCVPVEVDWKAGYKYVYTLDFTDGIGIQDPEDPNPGAPIIGSGIKFSVTLTPWENGTASDITPNGGSGGAAS